MSVFAKRLEGVSESATLRLNALVQELKQKGVDVINLTAGEPDFPPPESAKNAILEAVKKNLNKYTPAAGILELRSSIAERTNAQQPHVAIQHPWKFQHVVVTNGGKQALFNSFLALLDPGDEVYIPAPFWLSYPEMVKLASGTPKILPTSFEEQWKLSPQTLVRVLDQTNLRPRVLVLNSPSNPTGIMYSENELKALGAIIREHPKAKDLWVVSDEIYDSITFDGRAFCSFLKACPDLYLRTVTVNGMSKRAAMTGWRVGWSVAPQELTQALITLQGQSTSGINSLAQWAAFAVFKEPEAYFAQQTKIYEQRRNLALEILKQSSKIESVPPEGAFYIFLKVSKAFRASEDSFGFCERLLQEAKVAAVPGAPFGEDSSIRLSFALDDASLKKGCERIVSYLK